MERRKFSVLEQTKEYFSEVRKKMEENNRILEGKVFLFSDANAYMKMSITGVQQIVSLEIGAPLFQENKKRKNTDYIMAFINHAIEQSEINSLRDIINSINLSEFEEIVSSENKDFIGGVRRIEEDVKKINMDMHDENKEAISVSGKIKIEMSGIGLLESIDIDEGYFSIRHKNNIEMELQETINRVAAENRRNIITAMEKSAKRFDEGIDE